MALKRKLDIDSDDVAPTNAKQLKLVPFPNYEPDMDVSMSDDAMCVDAHHTRLSSTTSSYSSNASDSPLDNSPPYPTFDLYPSSPSEQAPSPHQYPYTPAQSPSLPTVGLIQPSKSFVHHGSNCSQIPKLRVACAPGLNGQRTMWSFCEQCGAISMVESD
ncbi:GATA-type domain-containing protein [Pleurotus pulmonarius]